MNLKNELKKRILEDMIKKCRTDDFVVLVVDPHTSKVVSSCCRMYDIMESGVLVLQNLNVLREKLELSAIYFIEPSIESVTKLVKDFNDQNKPQYASVHLYFSSRAEKDVMNLIASNKFLVSRIKSLKELNVDFLAIESRAFTFARTKTIPSLYFPTANDTLTLEMKRSAKQLSTLLLTIGEQPYIRYRGNNKLCKLFAEFLEKELNYVISQTREQNKEWKANEGRNRGTLLIVDRSIDPLAPVMHEYTYQAMLNDLLPVNGEICNLPVDEKEKKGEAEETTIVLSEDDHLWTSLRHHHIGKVMADITQKFREFKGSNKMAQLQSNENDASIKDMVKAMKEMPTYKSMMKQYHKHMSLAHECMDIYEKKLLHDLGELEQDMATGLTESGDKVNMKNIKQQLVKMCQDPKIGVVEKLRLLMIFIIAQGPMQEATRQELMKDISIRLQKAVRNLEKLGVDISVLNQNKSHHSKTRLEEFEKRNKTIPLALMRYVPFIHSVLNNLVTGQLSKDDYPYFSEQPSQSESNANKAAKKTTKSNWRSKQKDDKKEEIVPIEDSRTRHIVFMLGGMTFSELRSTYEICEQTNANLIIGSSSTITASDFIRGLADLDDKEDLVSANNENSPHRAAAAADDDDDIDNERDAPEPKKEEKEEPKKKKTKKVKAKEKKKKKKSDDDDSDDDDKDKTNDEFNKTDVNSF